MGTKKTGKRGITAVFSIITLLLLVIWLSGSAAIFILGYIDSLTGRSLMIQNVYPTSSGAEIFVKNDGMGVIQLSDVSVTDSNTGDAAIGAWTDTGGAPIQQLEPGKLAKFTTVCDGECSVKFIYSSSTSPSIKVTGSGTVCGDLICSPGEECLGDLSNCPDNPCYEPTCLNGCGQAAVPEDGNDESCLYTDICDGGGSCVPGPCTEIQYCPQYDTKSECEGNACGIADGCMWLEGSCMQPAN